MDVAVNKSVVVHAGSVDYQTFGANDAPETIVLLHASATGAWSLVPLAARLSETYRVFVPNLDGYGMSKLDCARCPVTFRHVQTVERFLQALEIESFHLVGHSMGGLIALRVARRGRFDLQSLTLIEPMAFGVLDPVTDKAAIDYGRNMINDFLSAIEAGSLEEGLSVFTERVSDQNGAIYPTGRASS
ncbi:MAG: alpha/beta fold hydrolase [Pseudomonadota bacterium]|nr:alpha/beta fold hydrolase [Pseudomonadota bacterium]